MNEREAPRVSAEAMAAAAATERWPTWLHRRYETIEFESVSSLRRSVRLDFSIPDEVRKPQSASWIVVPLMKVPKAEAGSVEVTDEGGAAVMVLTSIENRRLTAEMMLAQLRTNAAAEGFDAVCDEEGIAALFDLVSEEDRILAQKAASR